MLLGQGPKGFFLTELKSAIPGREKKMANNLQEEFETASFPKMALVSHKAWTGFEEIRDKVREESVIKVLRGLTMAIPKKHATIVVTEAGVHVFTKLEASVKKIGSGHEFFSYSTITGVKEYVKVLWKTCIDFTRANNNDSIGFFDAGEAAQVVSEVKSRMGIAQSVSTKQIVNNIKVDPLDQIKKLKDLLDAGALSQEEFEEKKKALMGRI